MVEHSRLFFALWPSQGCRAALEAAVAPLLSQARGRQVPAENYHLTLIFLGNVPTCRVASIAAAANAVSFNGFELCLDRFGGFPGPRVAWYGSSAHPPALEQLVRDLRRSLAPVVALRDEQRPYQPHVTLLRKQQSLPTFPAFNEVLWSVQDFVLVESRTGPGRAIYSVLQRYPAGQ
jgi:2'-5' RNA ligase